MYQHGSVSFYSATTYAYDSAVVTPSVVHKRRRDDEYTDDGVAYRERNHKIKTEDFNHGLKFLNRDSLAEIIRLLNVNGDVAPRAHDSSLYDSASSFDFARNLAQ